MVRRHGCCLYQVRCAQAVPLECHQLAGFIEHLQAEMILIQELPFVNCSVAGNHGIELVLPVHFEAGMHEGVTQLKRCQIQADLGEICSHQGSWFATKWQVRHLP